MASHLESARSVSLGAKMDAADVTVLTSGVAAATFRWWEPVVAVIPSAAQGLILTGTVVFVLFRAANEVLKFWKSQRDRKENEE